MSDYVAIRQDFGGRGVYICVSSDHTKYLYKDGAVREGVFNGTSTPFWPSVQEATDFYEEWENG